MQNTYARKAGKIRKRAAAFLIAALFGRYGRLRRKSSARPGRTLRFRGGLGCARLKRSAHGRFHAHPAAGSDAYARTRL